MSGQKVEVLHLPEVQAKIKRLGAGIQPALRKVSKQARRLLIGELTQYPPERPGQTYERTYKLQRGWERATPADQGRGFQIINAIPYVPLVQGDQQAWMHVGRWTPASEIAEKHAAEIVALYKDAVMEIAE